MNDDVMYSTQFIVKILHIILFFLSYIYEPVDNIGNLFIAIYHL